MPSNEMLGGRIRDEIAHQTGVTEKKMFGGIAFLLHGHLLVCVWDDSLIARVGVQASENALKQPHVRIMDVTGRPMKGWLIIEPAGLEKDRQLKSWINLAITFVAKLPPK